MREWKKTCAGCDYLCYDSVGSPHCKYIMENACIGSGFSFWTDRKSQLEKILLDITGKKSISETSVSEIMHKCRDILND